MREAPPSPAPGPERDLIVSQNEVNAQVAENAVTDALQRHLERMIGVVLAKIRGPKARRGTKWWTPSENGSTLEVKALDATYVVPDRLTDRLADDVRPVMLTIATTAATDTAQRLGEPDNLFAFDDDEISRAVDEAIRLILGIADRHVRELRAAVLDADTEADELEKLFQRIETAHRKGGNWVLMAGRTLANALANEASYIQALRLGCTRAQWVSRRDGRVRPTHVRADGQVRRLNQDFKVGKFRLKHPCDPADLPRSWPEVANCRCKLLFWRPSDNAQKLFDIIDQTARDSSAPRRSIEAIGLALTATATMPGGGTDTPTPEGYGLPPRAQMITLPEPVIGYRRLFGDLDVVPGQQFSPPGQLVLGLALTTAATASTLAVLVPAGTVVSTAEGAIILPAGTVLDVLGVGADGVRAQVVA